MKSKNSLLFIVIVILIAFVVFNVVNNRNFASREIKISYSQFLNKVSKNQITKVVIAGNIISAVASDKAKILTVYPYSDTSLIPNLKKHNIDISVKPPGQANSTSGLGSMYTWFFIIMFIGLIWFFIRRRSKGSGSSPGGKGLGGGGPFSFGKARAKMVTPKGDDRVMFEDVAGVKEAKEDLSEIVDFLKTPEKFKKLGAKTPKGFLLVGPPGTGKTLLAKAVAGEADVPFFVISGSDFVEMFVGVGASRVRDLFEQAKKSSPCILFIDEIDAVGRQRGAGLGGGNDEREQTLNQLLVEMDGFSLNQGVIVIAATNRPDVLDPALLRPGRFDRQITVPYPDIIGREQILRVHVKKVPLSDKVNITNIARGTTGFSGADLANLVNEAALFAARYDRDSLLMEDFEQARDKIIMGSERKSMKMTDEECKLTAYHEAGHTLVALNVKNYHPLHKVTIIPRGRALGVTSFLPEKDMLNYSFKQLTDQLAVIYGGRNAEEIIYGKDSITTGASNDIQVATGLARRMVAEWGFSDLLGKISYENNEGEVFLGHSVTQKKNMSEQTIQNIDSEIKRFIDEAEATAKKILLDKKDDLELITQGLLQYETLTADQVHTILKSKSIDSLKNIEEQSDSFKHHNKDNQTSLPVIE